METRKTQNAIQATVNELASFIRKNAPVKFGKVASNMHIAPSTLYGYTKIVLDMCSDITYSHGTFDIVKHHRMSNGKLVRVEHKGGESHSQ
jgi:hypothetical protein